MSAIELTNLTENWLKRNIEAAKFRRVSNVAVKVTPELAAEMLTKNEGNRNPRHGSMMMLSRAITNGEWIETGDTIKFDMFGRLLDGQHRLMAVVHADRSVNMDIVFGVSPEAFDRIDTGYARTTNQLLAMSGIKNGAVITSGARSMMAIQSGLSNTSSLSVSRHQVLDFVKKNPDIIEGARVSDTIKSRIGRVVSPGGTTAAITILTRRMGKDVDPFVDGLCSGANLTKESPILALRNRLIRGSTSKITDGVEIAALFIKAFNSWHAGRPVKVLSWRPADEDFPTVGA